MNTLVIMTQSQPFAKDLIRDNEIYNDIFSRASDQLKKLLVALLLTYWVLHLLALFLRR